MSVALSFDSSVPASLLPPPPKTSRALTPLDVRSLLESVVARRKESPRVERRSSTREPFAVMLELRPHESDVPPALAESLVVVGKDLSDHGIGFFHDRPIPFRRGVLTFGDKNGDSVSVEVEISWCRFKQIGWYESGCRLIRVVE